MSENITNKKPGEENNDSEQRRQEVQEQIEMSREHVPDDIILISIAYDTKTGSVQVAGPIANKHMFYGMLECARDCVLEWNRENVAGVVKP